MSEHLNDQEIARREKLKGFAELGIDPYPAAMWDVNATAKDILDAVDKYKEAHPGEEIHEVDGYKDISIAGRIMSINAKGKVTFIKIQDNTTRIQLFVSIDNVSPGEDKTFYNSVVKHLLDIGDFIGVKGEAFVTKTGETSIRVKELKVLGKALRPLPVVKEKDGEVFDAFSDPELRWRQRYVDLVVNSGVKETFLKRTQMVRTIRDFLNDNGAVEVDTPVLQTIPGGAAARPFITHHNALDTQLYLRIANELYLKRLIVGGFDFVYEFSRNFRNEGMSRKHNPEFTILEFYVAYKDYIWMMDFTERMLEKVATDMHGTTDLQVGENKINFKAPFKRITIYDAIKEYTGHDVSAMSEEQIYDTCKSLHLEVDKTMGKGKLIDELFSAKCEKNFIQPTFITDYPVEMSPLTKKHRSKEGLVERFELMVNGQEIGNAYSELNDPIDQRARFEEQVKLMERGDDEAMFIDYDFLRALEYGMPPTAGIGIGIDRLCMLMTNQATIQEVLFFPQMRPEWNFSIFVIPAINVFISESKKHNYSFEIVSQKVSKDKNSGFCSVKDQQRDITLDIKFNVTGSLSEPGNGKISFASKELAINFGITFSELYDEDKQKKKQWLLDPENHFSNGDLADYLIATISKAELNKASK